jgi:hypothetical protein
VVSFYDEYKTSLDFDLRIIMKNHEKDIFAPSFFVYASTHFFIHEGRIASDTLVNAIMEP